MKKNLLAGLLLLWACSVYGQKRIVDPVRSDFSYVAKFDRVEITGKRTVAEVTLRYLPNYWIRYDSLTTYLQDCGSDRRYRLLAAEGFELNKEVYMPESGEMKARFIFDPVDADVRCVDFIDPSWKKSHNTYGIFLERSEKPSVLPDWASGNWLTTDGSNRWVCGFLPQTAVWRNDFWDYGTVTRKGKTLWVQLKNGDRDTTLCLKEGRDGALLLGSDGRTFATLGRDLVRRTAPAAEWKYDPEKYRDVLYGKKKAVIRGVIDGYTPKLGYTTGSLGVTDHVLRRDSYSLIEIRPDGRFDVEVEVEAPQALYMQIGEDVSGYVFVAPGDTLMCYYSITDLQNPRRHGYEQIWDCSRFMGGSAPHNQFYLIAQRMMPNPWGVYDRMSECIEKDASDEFRAWIDGRLRQVDDSLAALSARYEFSARTRNLLYANFRTAEYRNLLNYQMRHSDRRYTYSQRPDGTYKATPNPDYRPLPKSFCDFMTMDFVDDPLMIATTCFAEVINRLEYGPAMFVGAAYNGFNKRYDSLGMKAVADVGKRMKASMPEPTPHQMATLDSLIAGKRDSAGLAGLDTIVIRRFRALEQDFLKREIARIRSEQERSLYRAAFDTLRSYGLDRCVAYDYTLARWYAGQGDRLENDSARLEEVARLLPYVKTPYVTGKIVQSYASGCETRRTQERQKPRTKADEYFDELIAPYKENVLFLDFWSTGCGPCRSGMIAAKPVVEELKDLKIKFLYITDESQSPVEVYDRFLTENGIGGEHIRVTCDQWNLLKAKFDIGGIPHYAVVDKQGRIVDNNGWCRIGPKHCKSKLLKLEKEP